MIEILACWRQGPIYRAYSIPWLLMAWQHKEPSHQQPWYWPSYPGIFWFQHLKVKPSNAHWFSRKIKYLHFDGSVQDCSNSIANTLELLQSCTKPSIWCYFLILKPCRFDEIYSKDSITTSKSRNYSFVLQVVTWAQAMPRPKVVPVNRPRRAVVAVAPRGSHIHRDQDSRWIEDLTHWGRDEIDAILQTLSNSFSLVKIYWFRLKFHWSLSSGPINNIPTLVQTMAWHQPGDKPISEPMIILLMHICLTRAQWVKSSLLLLTCWSLKKMTKISQTRQHF